MDKKKRMMVAVVVLILSFVMLSSVVFADIPSYQCALEGNNTWVRYYFTTNNDRRLSIGNAACNTITNNEELHSCVSQMWYGVPPDQACALLCQAVRCEEEGTCSFCINECIEQQRPAGMVPLPVRDGNFPINDNSYTHFFGTWIYALQDTEVVV